MTTYPRITLLVLAVLLATPLMAQNSPYGDNKPTAQNRGKNLTEEQRKKILKKFDKDRDGKLNEQESAAAKASLRAKKGSI